eukprot:1142196-Pelagomonas_calceolata.AAC.4
MCSIQDPTWLNRLSTAGVSPVRANMYVANREAAQHIAKDCNSDECLSSPVQISSGSTLWAPVEAWENCVWHAKNLQSSVEDLGAAMYPPQPVHTSRKGKACIAVPACKGSFKPENRRSQLHSSYHDSEAVPTLLN